MHPRRLTRLAEHDYSAPGAYFVTVCTLSKETLFGEVQGELVVLSAAGRIVSQTWYDLPKHYSHIELDAFVAMPNHVHGILFIREGPIAPLVGAGLRPAPTRLPLSQGTGGSTRRHGLSEIVRAFKSFSARRINALRGIPGVSVWQRGFYDHVIRGGDDLTRIRDYILTNPLRWSLDTENPAATRGA